jgi:two-component system, cell cycle response regulator
MDPITSNADSTTADLRPARLLAIDDSTLIHRLLKARLKRERLHTHHALSGEEGLAMARELVPDVILLDLDMPDRNGFQVLHALKEDPRTHDIPVIFISGSCSTEQKVQGLEMGAIDFVTKPFELAELRARVRSALRMHELIRMLAERAQLDALTGLWNRAYFDERFKREIDEAKRHGHPLSLIFTDIDHFKNVNDTYGHSFGDHVLEEFAHVLSRGRSGDIPCRYGGEEFVIIAPHTSADDTRGVAERHREALQAMRWEGRPELTVTASFGIADAATVGGHDPQELINAADQALYIAKESGRNLVHVATNETAASAGESSARRARPAA